MNQRLVLIVVALSIVVAMRACRARDTASTTSDSTAPATPASDTATHADTRAPAAAVDTGAARDTTDCPATGTWAECSVRKRLESAGLSPRDTAPSADVPAGLGVQPRVWVVGRGVVHAYLYADAAARERATRALDTTRWVAPATTLDYRADGTAIANANLLVLLVTRREQLRERVSDLIGAGAPQPDPAQRGR